MDRNSALAAEVSRLIMQNRTLAQDLLYHREHARCSRFNEERPLEQHSPASVCENCYQELRRHLARVTLVSASIAEVVRVWMRGGRTCPFCETYGKHSESCYLALDAGQTLLDEYAAIERHRDLLLGEKTRVNGNGAAKNGTALSLKTRFLHHEH